MKVKIEESEKEKQKVIGKHIVAELYGIDESLLQNEGFLLNLIYEAARVGNMHIVKVLSGKFNVKGSMEEGGVSILAIITESHIAIHTWPENNFATLDIYSCGENSDPESAFQYIISRLKPKTYTRGYFDRSNVLDWQY